MYDLIFQSLASDQNCLANDWYFLHHLQKKFRLQRLYQLYHCTTCYLNLDGLLLDVVGVVHAPVVDVKDATHHQHHHRQHRQEQDTGSCKELCWYRRGEMTKGAPGGCWSGGSCRDLNPGPLAPEARIIPLDHKTRLTRETNIAKLNKSYLVWLSNLKLQSLHWKVLQTWKYFH